MKSFIGKTLCEIASVLEWVGLSIQGRREDYRDHRWGGF